MADNPKPRKAPFNLFAKHNRGLLLDIVVFIANVFLMRLLLMFVLGVFKDANKEEPGAQLLLLLGAIAMWILPPAGAVLKRWHFHRRLAAEHKTLPSADSPLVGCIFNPLIYFSLNILMMSIILAGVGTTLLDKKTFDRGDVFVPSIFIGLGLTIVQTYLIYRYFSPPKGEPSSRFLLSPESELLGDICIFVNMLLFQVAWNLLTLADLPRISGVADFFGRLFFLSFVALLIYFPPRMFYLAEDINRGRTWITMLLANSPVILRILIGHSNQTGW
ncbi:MAG TPA: hypothetical protein VI306_14380 [Pyrinomonadaceae bacterium]